MATTEQLHKAMIPLCLAIETLADALERSPGDLNENAARHARELVNDAHRHMCESADTPLVKIEDEV